MKKNNFKIGNKFIGNEHPTYFIADIAANHDGNLSRALKLIRLAAKSGANAAKFQHFKADTIVSDVGFKKLGGKQSHQSKWKKSVFQVYKDASLNIKWTKKLKNECKKNNIDFFTSAYDFELVDQVDPYVPCYKIGSGDITYLEIIKKIAKKNKPYILATGAANLSDVTRAVKACYKINKKFSLMQCNTNYTGSLENFKYINLKVLQLYKKKFPNIILGLSDHTKDHATVLGAVTLGARIVEKHFTDNRKRIGPDHKFSMMPRDWKTMVDRTRELELSLGNNLKKVEKNELQTVILQRRALRAKINLLKKNKIKKFDIIALRPCPKNAIPPYELNKIINKKLKKNILKGDIIKWSDLI